jgi:hypothetical protein
MIFLRIKSVVLALSLTAACISPAAFALKADGVVGLQMEYTDNAALTANNEINDTIATAILSGTLVEDKGPVTGKLDASVRQLDYLDNTFGDETYLNVGAEGQWEQIRNRLVWNVENFYDQISQDTLAADVPSNLEDTNAFRLSATATFPVAERHTLIIVPEFSDYYYEKSNNDNQQLGLSVEWAYLLNPSVQISLIGDVADVNHDQDLVTAGISADHERHSARLRVKATRPRTRYEATAGYTEIDRDLGPGVDGEVGSVTIEHDFTGRSTLIAHASTDISDTSNNFLSASANPALGSFVNVQSSSDVIKFNVMRLTYDRNGDIIKSSVKLELSEQDYNTAPLDRKVQELSASLSYGFTPRITGALDAGYIITDEEAFNTEDKEFIIGSRVNYQLDRKLSTNAGLQFANKDSDAVPDRGYDEWRVFAGVAYRLGR